VNGILIWIHFIQREGSVRSVDLSFAQIVAMLTMILDPAMSFLTTKTSSRFLQDTQQAQRRKRSKLNNVTGRISYFVDWKLS